MKKGHYVYYHCTGHRGTCPERYVREEVLEERFTDLVAGIVFSDEMLDEVAAAMRSVGEVDRQQHEAAVRRLQQEHQRLQDRIERMYEDKLDGRVEQELYDRKAAEWRAQQAEITRQIAAHQKPQEAEVDVWALAAKAVELFQKQPAREKRKLLDYVVSRCSWKNRVLTPQWRRPFGMMAQARAA